MPDLILHHYPESPFSEKIRALLGFQGAAWHSVVIPTIMPKPDLVCLTGGYRKTPVLQVGADIYCDTALIARVLDERKPSGIYPGAHAAAIGTMAQWTDSALFRMAVAQIFQPKAMAGNPLAADPQAMAKFVEDRAALTRGSAALRMPLELAATEWTAHMMRLERQLSDRRPFLFGEQPTIADFSTYHCIWFLYIRPALQDQFKDFPRLLEWRARMQDFGHGDVAEMTSADAVALAKRSQAGGTTAHDHRVADGLQPGAMVEVAATDYGFDPVRGELLVSTVDEIAVRRSDERAGELVVHFPRIGFRVDPVKDA